MYSHIVTILVKLTVISNSCYFGTLLVYDDNDKEKELLREARHGSLGNYFCHFLELWFSGAPRSSTNSSESFGFQANDISRTISNTLRELAASLVSNANKFDVTLKGT